MTNRGAISCDGSSLVSRTSARMAGLVLRRRGLCAAEAATVGTARVTAAARCLALVPAASATTLKPESRAAAEVRGPIVIAGGLVAPPALMHQPPPEPDSKPT